jgi:hypothetical protein
MARPKPPQWKLDIIQNLAAECNKPGGSYLLRKVYAPGVALATGWKKTTVCKYVEVILSRHPKEEW